MTLTKVLRPHHGFSAVTALLVFLVLVTPQLISNSDAAPSPAAQVTECVGAGCKYSRFSTEWLRTLSPGATVRVLPGTYSVDSAHLNQSLTLEFQGAVVLTCPSGGVCIWITSSSAEVTFYGNVTLSGSGILINQGGRLIQHADMAIIVNANFSSGIALGEYGANLYEQRGTLRVESVGTNPDSYGLTLQGTSRWEQYNTTTVAIRHGTAVLFEEGGQWNQIGSTTITLSPSIEAAYGVRFASLDHGVWKQQGPVSITSTGIYGVGVYCGGVATGWTSSVPVQVSVPMGGSEDDCFPEATYIFSNTSTIATVPVLQFNRTEPAVVVIPKNGDGSVSAISTGISVSKIREYDKSEGTTVQFGLPNEGTWREVEDDELGALSSFLFSSPVQFTHPDGSPSSEHNDSRLELQFFLFEQETQLSVGDLAFSVSPYLAKFSIALFNWPWNSTSEHKIEVRMKIQPTLGSVVRRNDTPSVGVTTFDLLGQFIAAGSPSTMTQLRLITAVSIDGAVNNEGGVEFDVEEETSELIMRFAYFKSTLLYDPDIGVLLGSSKAQQGSDDTGLITGAVIGATVGAILLVLVVVVAATLFAWWRKGNQDTLGAINLGAEEDEDNSAQL